MKSFDKSQIEFLKLHFMSSKYRSENIELYLEKIGIKYGDLIEVPRELLINLLKGYEEKEEEND